VCVGTLLPHLAKRGHHEAQHQLARPALARFILGLANPPSEPESGRVGKVGR